MKLPTIAPQFALLDGPGNWRILEATNLLERPTNGALVLQPLPGRAKLLLRSEQTSVVDPAALAVDTDGRLLVADAGAHVVHRLTWSAQTIASIETIEAFGSRGARPRQFDAPHGLAALPRGAVAVADTGNRRVQLFSSAPFALLDLWDTSPERPWGIASDKCGDLYVTELGVSACVRQLTRGTTTNSFGRGELRHPTRVALGTDGLAVVDLDPRPSGKSDASRVVFYPFSGNGRIILNKVSRPRAVAFDAAGTLFVGDASGLVHRFEPDCASPGRFRLAGAGDTGLDGEFVDLAWSRSHGLLAIIREHDFPRKARLYRIDPAGACAREGDLVAGPLDGLIAERLWHRVELATESSGNAFGIKLQTFSTDDRDAKPTPQDWADCLSANDDNPDGLVRSQRGRYLWIRLTVRCNGRGSPAITALQAHFPRVSYLEYLPAVFQEDPASRAFLDRLLAIFQTGFDGFDRRIDEVWRLFDPATVRESDFPWLAAWLDLPFEPDWPIEKRREMLASTPTDYPRRGTIDWLRRAIEKYAGVPNAQVLEHFRLRRWPFLGSPEPQGLPEDDVPKYWPRHVANSALDRGTTLFSRAFYGRMQLGDYSQIGLARIASRPDPEVEPFAWGAHRFTVFFPADPYRVEATRERVARVVELEKPAHTQAELCPVFPRMRIGVQSQLGYDTMVGGISYLVLGQLSTLGYDTILSSSARENDYRVLGAAVTPRLGVQTTLL